MARDDKSGLSGEKGLLRLASLALFVPALMCVGPVGGYLGGFYLGQALGLGKWTGFVGLVLGSLAAGREVWRIIRRLRGMIE